MGLLAHLNIPHIFQLVSRRGLYLHEYCQLVAGTGLLESSNIFFFSSLFFFLITLKRLPQGNELERKHFFPLFFFVERHINHLDTRHWDMGLLVGDSIFSRASRSFLDWGCQSVSWIFPSTPEDMKEEKQDGTVTIFLYSSLFLIISPP